MKARHANAAFSGEGARLYGGRWTGRGRRAVYTSSTIALATLELLVHLGSVQPLAAYRLFRVTIPDGLIRPLPSGALPSDWRAYPAPAALQALGDRWLASGETAVLEVPSAIVEREVNYLLNPEHPDFGKILLGEAQPYAWDPRLRR